MFSPGGGGRFGQGFLIVECLTYCHSGWLEPRCGQVGWERGAEERAVPPLRGERIEGSGEKGIIGDEIWAEETVVGERNWDGCVVRQIHLSNHLLLLQELLLKQPVEWDGGDLGGVPCSLPHMRSNPRRQKWSVGPGGCDHLDAAVVLLNAQPVNPLRHLPRNIQVEQIGVRVPQLSHLWNR